MQAQSGQILLPGISFSGLLSLHKLLVQANLQSRTQASMDRVDGVRAILDYFKLREATQFYFLLFLGINRACMFENNDINA